MTDDQRRTVNPFTPAEIEGDARGIAAIAISAARRPLDDVQGKAEIVEYLRALQAAGTPDFYRGVAEYIQAFPSSPEWAPALATAHRWATELADEATD